MDNISSDDNHQNPQQDVGHRQTGDEDIGRRPQLSVLEDSGDDQDVTEYCHEADQEQSDGSHNSHECGGRGF